MKRITTSHISLQDLSKSTSEKGEKSSSNFFYPKKNWVARNIKTLFGAYSDKNRDCSIAITTKIPTLRGDILLNILITFEKQKTIRYNNNQTSANYDQLSPTILQYNTIYNIYLPYTTFTHGKKKWRKLMTENKWRENLKETTRLITSQAFSLKETKNHSLQ